MAPDCADAFGGLWECFTLGNQVKEFYREGRSRNKPAAPTCLYMKTNWRLDDCKKVTELFWACQRIKHHRSGSEGRKEAYDQYVAVKKNEIITNRNYSSLCNHFTIAGTPAVFHQPDS